MNTAAQMKVLMDMLYYVYDYYCTLDNIRSLSGHLSDRTRRTSGSVDIARSPFGGSLITVIFPNSRQKEWWRLRLIALVVKVDSFLLSQFA